MSEFELSERYVTIRREAQALAASVEPLAVVADSMSEPHPGMLQALRDSGLTGLMVPSSFGGRSEQVDPLAVCVAREALMSVSSHLDSVFALQGIGSYALSMGGSDAAKTRWLPRVARLDSLAALALTEPEAGSDLKAIETRLRSDAGRLVLSGEKSWISNAGHADFYCVLAREEEGYSMVLVASDAPGVSTASMPELSAPHILGSVAFDDVVVTEEDRLGEPGSGFDLVLQTLAVFRVSVAGASLGLAESALQTAVRHAATRHQFGRPIARHGAVASMLADCWTDLEQARLLTYRAASRAREDALGNLHHSSMAKLAASEAAARIADRCVQIMGRWGLVKDSKVERVYRQARPMRIYEGTSEILRLGIARALVESIGN